MSHLLEALVTKNKVYYFLSTVIQINWGINDYVQSELYLCSPERELTELLNFDKLMAVFNTTPHFLLTICA